MSVLNLNNIIEESFKENSFETVAKSEVVTENVKLGGDLMAIAEGKGFEQTKPKENKEVKLDINLESIQNIEENYAIYDEDLIGKVSSAFSIDRLVEESIVENIMNDVEAIEEAQGVIKNVVRQGQIKEKLFCPPGFKSQGDKCVKMTQQEVMSRRKAAKIAIRTRASHYAANRMKSAKSRAKSMKVRTKKASVVAKTRVGG